MSRSEDVAAAATRRNEIVNHLLEFLTGDTFTTKELQHMRFVADIFVIAPVLKELCASASTLEGRTELALAAAMCALNLAIDETPPPPTAAQLERKERREASKQFEASLAGKSDADCGACVAEPDKPVKPPSIHNRPRASLSPEQFERARKSGRERQARWRAKPKFGKTGNASGRAAKNAEATC